MKPHHSIKASLIITLLIATVTPSAAQVHHGKLQATLQQKIDSLRNVIEIPAIAFSCILPSGNK